MSVKSPLAHFCRQASVRRTLPRALSKVVRSAVGLSGSLGEGDLAPRMRADWLATMTCRGPPGDQLA